MAKTGLKYTSVPKVPCTHPAPAQNSRHAERRRGIFGSRATRHPAGGGTRQLAGSVQYEIRMIRCGGVGADGRRLAAHRRRRRRSPETTVNCSPGFRMSRRLLPRRLPDVTMGLRLVALTRDHGLDATRFRLAITSLSRVDRRVPLALLGREWAACAFRPRASPEDPRSCGRWSPAVSGPEAHRFPRFRHIYLLSDG